MTRKTNARVAGLTYLLYIAVAYPGLVLSSKATRGATVAEKLATAANHIDDLRLVIISSFLSGICAVVLAVTLYAITRDEDEEIALLGLTCRVSEGIIGAGSILLNLGLMAIAHDGVMSNAASYPVAAALLDAGDGSTRLAASFFAVGSTLFSYLLLRGRIVPWPLAALGFLGSLVISFGIPAQMAAYLSGSVVDLMFIPVAGFEILVALWLIFKGAAMPRVAKPAVEHQLAR
jgi:hypothetical protein